MAATITTSIITGGTNNHATSSAEANALASDFVTQGVVGSFSNTAGIAPNTGSFAVNAQASPAMFVDVTAGTAYITATPTSQTSQSLRAYMSANYTSYAISSNSSGSTKYDWIYLSVSATNANTPSAAADNVTSLYTSRSSSSTTDNGSPPAYGILLAIVTVANGASSIANAQIQDRRAAATLNSPTTAGWTSLGIAPSTVTYNGNRSYSLVFNSTDLTGTLSTGMRLRTTRTVTAPTQCTSLNGTTQYYSKTSPAGLSGLTAVTASAWVKLTSYVTQANIIGNANSADNSGFNLMINGSGQVRGYYGSGANFTDFITYQSIPLNKWVHIAWAATAATKVGAIYIDGVSVPISSGTATATSITNTTQPLAIGAFGASTAGTFFPGKLAQVAVFNAALTQATIQSYISQGLAGTETSLISAYSFNNSINDLNANANNLTANGSAVATNADTPFTNDVSNTSNVAGTTNYGIITAISFSTNTTVTCQVPEGGSMPTSGGISAVSYSSLKVPYGFPAQRGKWRIETLNAADNTVTNAGSGTFNNHNLDINVPVGEWLMGYEVRWYQQTSANSINAVIGLSTSTSAFSDKFFAVKIETASTGSLSGNQSRNLPYSLSNATVFHFLSQAGTAQTGVMGIRSATDSVYSTIYAELAHL